MNNKCLHVSKLKMVELFLVLLILNSIIVFLSCVIKLDPERIEYLFGGNYIKQ